jgi:class 3 adenylate cyclase/tetratricopeptide (TPR) repeat protein
MTRAVGDWLRELGLAEHADAFATNGVDFDLLPELTNEDLKDLGIARLADRKLLLKAIAELRGGEKGEPAGSTSSAMPAGERRQVTVLFADLTGFTQMSRALGAEATHALLNRYFELVDGIVQDCGGSVDKHIGDNVMAVFGAPVAHADDPERAIRAAFDIHAAVSRLGGELGRALAAHIGIASGQVVASGTGSDTHREYTVIGDSVNLASRLQDKAQSGETLISDALHHALADRIDCDRMDDVAVKGLDAPVRVWRVKSLRAREAAPAPVAFVGRRRELALFIGIAESCRASGQGQTVVVRGEAGMGKSRLVDEYTRIATEKSFAVHRGLVLDFGTGRGEDAFRSVVRSLVGLAPGGDQAARRAAAEAVAARGMLAAGQAVFLNDLLDLEQSLEDRAAFDAMDNEARNEGKRALAVDLLRSVSAVSPVVIIVEDLHWADRLMLMHLARMAVAVADFPALLVVTTRIEGDPLDEAWRSKASGASLTTIDLGPILGEDARSIAEALVPAKTAFAERCVERAAGNPLFLEQLLRHAEESEDSVVPGSVQSLVQARIDRLDPADKTAVQIASVLGQLFARAALVHLLDRKDYDIGRLVARRLVRPQQTDEEVYLFSHALVRDAIYDTLLESRRRELHRRAANWYAEHDAVLRAEHLGRAEDPEAAHAYLAAARLQAAAYRHDAALQLVVRGLALTTAQADRCALLLFQGEIQHHLGVMLEARQAYQSALDAAADDRERCAAWIGLATVKRVTDDLPGAAADLEQAEAVAARHELIVEQARIHFLRGNLCFPRGDIEGCLREHGVALERAQRAGAAELQAMALGGLGDAEYVRGRMSSAHVRFRHCVDVSAGGGFGRVEVANRPMMAFSRWFCGDVIGAIDDADAAIEAAVRVGHRRAEMIGHHAAFFARHALMDFDAAIRHAEAALALSRQLGARRFDALALAFRAELHRLAGQRAQAFAEAEEAVKITRDTGPAFLGPFALGALARATDDPAIRGKALEEGSVLLRAGAFSANYFLFGRDAIDACLSVGDLEGAERFAAALEDYTRAEPLPLTDFYIARARALVAHGRGSMPAAALAATLDAVRETGTKLNVRIALPAIETAIAAGPR